MVMHLKNSFLLILGFSLFVFGCGNPVKPRISRGESPIECTSEPNRSIYHWKTTFNLTPKDSAFITDHKITRLYVRMFDVGMERNESNDSLEVVPLGTIRFKSALPKNCEFIPTVYITQDALKAYCYGEWKLAELIVTRVKAMASWNELGDFSELQYDCDWTTETRKSFERLCESTKKILDKDGIILSGTIRLHQLEEAVYPFDRGVLMIYNTGSFVNPNTKNSILYYDDVRKYLSVGKRVRKFIDSRKNNCQIIDVAYPTFSWGVVFDDSGNYKRLVKDISRYELQKGERMRVEVSDYKEIQRAKHLVDSLLYPAVNGNIIYHLDTENLKNYDSEQIENIYN